MIESIPEMLCQMYTEVGVALIGGKKLLIRDVVELCQAL